MYDWRKMDEQMRRMTLEKRREAQFPAHDLPHFDDTKAEYYSVTGTNYEHVPILGKNSSRMSAFADRLEGTLIQWNIEIEAWCLMRNHYHLLLHGESAALIRRLLGKLHGATSREWNLEDDCVGRKVWFRVFDKSVRSQRQFYSSLNYIHFNPVKAGYCGRMSEWKWSSFHSFLEREGMERVRELWRLYPPSESAFRKSDRE
jgi:putative transposase